MSSRDERETPAQYVSRENGWRIHVERNGRSSGSGAPTRSPSTEKEKHAWHGLTVLLRLRLLTGIDAQENQARRLLQDISGFRAQLGDGTQPPDTVVAARWLAEVYEPTLARIAFDLNGTLEPAEAFHQLLEHRWFLSEAKGSDVGLDTAVASYVEHVLRIAPAESPRALTTDDPPGE